MSCVRGARPETSPLTLVRYRSRLVSCARGARPETSPLTLVYPKESTVSCVRGARLETSPLTLVELGGAGDVEYLRYVS